MLLYACSSNKGKLAEFVLAGQQAGLAQLRILPLPDLAHITAPEETGSTFDENAALKAIYYSKFTTELCFADDSGLEVDALGGEPGVYSARYAGQGATDKDNNALLLERLGSSMNRHARFVCAIALAQAGTLVTVVHGTVEGEILTEERGSHGFGYDPLFFYRPKQCTLAELDGEEKFAISHRGQAVRSMLTYLRAHTSGLS